MAFIKQEYKCWGGMKKYSTDKTKVRKKEGKEGLQGLKISKDVIKIHIG